MLWCSLLLAELSLPQICMLKFQPPVPQNVTAFGEWNLKDVMISVGWALIYVTIFGDWAFKEVIGLNEANKEGGP